MEKGPGKGPCQRRASATWSQPRASAQTFFLVKHRVPTAPSGRSSWESQLVLPRLQVRGCRTSSTRRRSSRTGRPCACRCCSHPLVGVVGDRHRAAWEVRRRTCRDGSASWRGLLGEPIISGVWMQLTPLLLELGEHVQHEPGGSRACRRALASTDGQAYMRPGACARSAGHRVGKLPVAAVAPKIALVVGPWRFRIRWRSSRSALRVAEIGEVAQRHHLHPVEHRAAPPRRPRTRGAVPVTELARGKTTTASPRRRRRPRSCAASVSQEERAPAGQDDESFRNIEAISPAPATAIPLVRSEKSTSKSSSAAALFDPITGSSTRKCAK